MSTPPDSDGSHDGVHVTANIPVDPRIVDINMLSEAILRITGCIGQIMQIMHAVDATEEDKKYAGHWLNVMMTRVEHEFRPYIKEAFHATKH